jgi:hypothetical protein
MNLKYRGIYSSRKPGGGGGIKILPLRDLGKNISTLLEFSEFWVIFSGFVNIVA